jgi:hypothetical protein
MTAAPDRSEPSPPVWRFRLGIVLFALGLACPAFVPGVAATDLGVEWKTILSGALMLGVPELLWLSAAGVMGREGFEYLKGRVFRFLRRHALPHRVSRRRYRIGLAMFALPVLLGWLAPYVSGSIPGYETHRVALNLTGDLVLLASLFVLGGGFWDKLTALFLYDARAQLPSR